MSITVSLKLVGKFTFDIKLMYKENGYDVSCKETQKMVLRN